VARVWISGGTPTRAMNQPLTKPANPPAATARRIESSSGKPRFFQP
jgi:hypothetical protein